MRRELGGAARAGSLLPRAVASQVVALVAQTLAIFEVFAPSFLFFYGVDAVAEPIHQLFEV